MRKLAFATAAAITALVAVPASAATTINLVPTGGTLTGIFGNTNPHGSGTDLYDFTVPTSGDLYGFVGSVGLRITLTNLDFTSVTLDGNAFNQISSGVFELQTIAQSILAGNHTISVSYANAQRESSYAGLLSFNPSATPAVPEPATWAMMILGFGLIGGAMRYRRRETAVRFA
ncbi:MAG: FxDxF family PEP-CTERM protein [Sphingomonas bacterium]